METPKGMRKSFSIADKLELLEKYDALPPGTKQEEAARRLGVKRPTLCKILKTRNDIQRFGPSSKKRRRKGKAPAVESALVMFVQKSRERNIPLSAGILKRKAEVFAEKLGDDYFKVTNGWFDRFRRRNDIDLMLELEERRIVLDSYHHWLDLVPLEKEGIDDDQIVEEVRTMMVHDERREEERLPSNREIVAAADVLEKVFRQRGSHPLADLLNCEVQKVLLGNMKEITVHKISSKT